MLLSEIQNSLKLALPYLTKRCLKCYLGREQSFDKGSVAYKSVALKKACIPLLLLVHCAILDHWNPSFMAHFTAPSMLGRTARHTAYWITRG